MSVSASLGADSAVTQLPADVEAFLSTGRTAVLFCRDAGGRPIGYPMSVFRVMSGRLLFTTYTKSAKVAHLRRDPRATCVVTEPETTEPGTTEPGTVGRWIAVPGTVELHHPDDAEIDAYFAGRAQDPRVPDTVTASVKARLRERKRVVLILMPRDPSSITVETRA